MYNEDLKRIDEVISSGPFTDSWDSLGNYQVPKWYQNAKFGIFSHFGPYTVPEYGHDWYVHGMYTDGDFINEHHKKTYGPLESHGYKHLVSLFKPEKFSSEEWVKLIKNSGAKYYVPVAEHHDGFQMYESKYSKWNSMTMSPHIDFIKELKEECLKSGIEFGTSTHRAEHWFFLSPGLECASDVHDAEYGDLYWPTKPKKSLGDDKELTKQYLEDWMLRTIEIIDLHKPRVLYFDFWIEEINFKPYMKKILAYYYNTMLKEYGDCGVVNYKHDGIAYGCAVRDMERGQFDSIQRDYWQACTASSHGAWIYTKSNEYKGSTELIRTLVDIVSKNGNLLLNIGPKAGGTICQDEVDILTEIGSWNKLNGEAIFDTHPWKIFGEGKTNVAGGDFSEGKFLDYKSSDIRFTSKANKVYAIFMNPKGLGKLCINNFGLEKKELKKNNQIDKLTVLGHDVIDYERKADCLEIILDKEINCEVPVVVKVELA